MSQLRGAQNGPSVARFLKESRDAPHRSKQAKSFVDELCSYVLRWFTAASAEDLSMDTGYSSGWRVVVGGGHGFISATSFVGYLIEWGLLSDELVRRHLVKPLIAHRNEDREDVQRSVRAMAIYQLFAAARNSLLQGLHDGNRDCLKRLVWARLPGLLGWESWEGV